MHKNHTIVTLKGFGDFVIAANAINNIQEEDDRVKLDLVASKHVINLAKALDIKGQTRFIGGEDNLDVPAIFNLKKCGLLSGVKSLLELRRCIKDISPASALVFDRLGWRERIIGIGHSLYDLPHDSSNIYLAYNRFIENLGYKTIPDKPKSNFVFNQAVIIPGARINQRTIPDKIIDQIAEKLLMSGIKTKVILLDGESFDTSIGVDIQTIPRQFISLITAIKSAKLVISADSLSAHLSEFFNIPVFVVTPIPKWSTYWLPKSAFKSKGMTSFENLDYIDQWIASVQY